MVPLRKTRAGSCNLGYTWACDGAVVEVADADAAELLAIPGGEYALADTGPQRQIEEPAPEPEISEAPAPRPAKKAAARKGAAANLDE